MNKELELEHFDQDVTVKAGRRQTGDRWGRGLKKSRYKRACPCRQEVHLLIGGERKVRRNKSKEIEDKGLWKSIIR